jgi:hypothetical protein
LAEIVPQILAEGAIAKTAGVPGRRINALIDKSLTMDGLEGKSALQAKMEAPPRVATPEEVAAAPAPKAPETPEAAPRTGEAVLPEAPEGTVPPPPVEGTTGQVDGEPNGDAFLSRAVAQIRADAMGVDLPERGATTEKTMAAIAAVRERLSADYPHLYSPARIVDCVEAALTRAFDDGCAYEASAFMDCLASPQRQALVHVFFAEREVRTSEQSGVDLVALGTALREARDAAIAQLVHNGDAPADVYAALSTWGMSLDAAAGDARVAPDTVNVCTQAMAAAAREALASGAARIAADCDVASIRHAGFPRSRGGVLWYAEHGAAITP